MYQHTRRRFSITIAAILLTFAVFPAIVYGAPSFDAITTPVTPADNQFNDGFSVVALDGNTLAVGAPTDSDQYYEAGAVYIFERNEGGADNWGLVKQIYASDAEYYGEFGGSVDISGDTIVVGSKGSGTAGAAYVFGRDVGGTDNWGQVKKLVASDPTADQGFGWNVTIDADTIVIGAPLDPYTQQKISGSAYVFERNYGGNDNWGQTKKIEVAQTAPNESTLGITVGFDADTIALGALSDSFVDGSRIRTVGAVYVFYRDQGGADNWGQVTKIEPSDPEDSDYFGWHQVRTSGDIIAVGVPWKSGNYGAVYIYERNAGGANNWGEVKKIAGETNAGRFGSSLDLNGTSLVVVQRQVLSTPGTAFVYDRDYYGARSWRRLGKIEAGSGETFNSSFSDVSAISTDGTFVVTGTRQISSVTKGTAFVSDYEMTPAVYRPEQFYLIRGNTVVAY